MKEKIIRDRIMKLEEEMALEIEKTNYEYVAQIRDKIRHLNNELKEMKEY